MRNVINGTVFCNYQNIIHFYEFSLKITKFRFSRIFCLIADSILCTPPLIFSIFNDQKLTALIYKFLSCLPLKHDPTPPTTPSGMVRERLILGRFTSFEDRWLSLSRLTGWWETLWYHTPSFGMLRSRSMMKSRSRLNWHLGKRGQVQNWCWGWGRGW